MNAFENLAHGDKIIHRKSRVVYGWCDVHGEKHVLGDGIGWPVSAFQPEDFELYAGSKNVGEADINYPVYALVAVRACPECSEDMEGSWSFCPWCGVKIPGTNEEDSC